MIFYTDIQDNTNKRQCGAEEPAPESEKNLHPRVRNCCYTAYREFAHGQTNSWLRERTSGVGGYSGDGMGRWEGWCQRRDRPGDQ